MLEDAAQLPPRTDAAGSRPPPRVCVILPTFNNDFTLARVLGEARERMGDIIVVNDGSTDGTAEVLRGFPAVTVITHGHNMGKGAALADGLARAKAMGFTHAISMDADGQHAASDLPAFLSAICANPDALVIGVRRLARLGGQESAVPRCGVGSASPEADSAGEVAQASRPGGQACLPSPRVAGRPNSPLKKSSGHGGGLKPAPQTLTSSGTCGAGFSPRSFFQRAAKRRALRSRVLRAHSNFWVWAETGRWLRDTQSGFRAYPLESVEALALAARRYDFEIECLVKAMWCGVPVAETPVRVEYGPGSRSHFRPFSDFARVSRLNAWLVAERLLLPMPIRRAVNLKSYRERPRGERGLRKLIGEAIMEQCRAPGVFAASVGLGVFFGIAPIWGFQMIAAVVVAHALRLRKVVALVATNVSFPAAIPFILYASLLLGRLAFTGRVDTSLSVANLNLGTIGGYLAEYVAGSLILATAMGLLAGAATWFLARLAARAGGSFMNHQDTKTQSATDTGHKTKSASALRLR